MKTRVLIVTIFTWLISACSSTVDSISQDVDLNLDSDMGYLLIGVDTNSSIDKLFMSGQRSVLVTRKDLGYGKSYILLDMPAGKYTIDKVVFSNYWRVELEEGHWGFEVSPGQISYVGHLDVNTYSHYPFRTALELENRSSEALVYMTENYPTILNSRLMHYDGPGEDPYFEHIRKLSSKKEAE